MPSVRTSTHVHPGVRIAVEILLHSKAARNGLGRERFRRQLLPQGASRSWLGLLGKYSSCLSGCLGVGVGVACVHTCTRACVYESHM